MQARAELSEDFGGDAEPCADSLWAWLSERGSQNRDQPALVVRDLDTGDWTAAWDYGRLLDRVEELAGIWAKAGITAHDTLFVFVDNTMAADWTLTFWLAARLGLTFMPLDVAIFNRPDELKSIIRLLQPTAVVVQDVRCAREWDGLHVDYEPIIQRVCGTFEHDESTWTALRSSEDSASPAPLPKSEPRDIAIIMNTTGSTGLPKCCPVTVRMLVTEIRQYHSLYNAQFHSAMKHLVSTSVSRPISYLACVNTWIAGGAAVFTGQAFDSSTTLEAIDKAKCTHAWFVPAMINILHSEKHSSKLESLQTVLMSGDTAEAKTIERAKELLPTSCHFISSWGMSEGAPVFGCTEDEQMSFDKSSGIAGVGRALRGTKVRVCEGETRNATSRGQQGSLHVSSDATIDRYLDNRNEEDFYEDQHGRWFKTGDTAIMDASGVIYIVGRTKDIIVYRGRNIVPTTVQSYLKSRFPADWVVIALKDEINGEIPAAVANKLSVAKQQVLDYVKHAEIDDCGLQGGIYELKELGLTDWPYNSSNKIQKSELVEVVERARAKCD